MSTTLLIHNLDIRCDKQIAFRLRLDEKIGRSKQPVFSHEVGQ